MGDLSQFGQNQFNVLERNVGMNNEQTKVTVGLGYTLNLGNFQSLRIDLSVTDNKREGENTNDAFERVYSFVETKLQEKITEAQGEIEGK
jgi:hypothetical protein